MHITHFGHSAVLLDYPQADADRVLIDPGAFSRPDVAELTDLNAIVVTHQHPDHVDPARFAQLADSNPDAALLLEPQTAEMLSAHDQTASLSERLDILRPGDPVAVGPLTVSAAGGAHAIIHPDIPAVGNLAVIIEADGEKTFAHTGDSLVPHPELLGIDVIAYPAVAPWSKMQDTIDFLRITKPGIALPVHDAVASAEGRAIYLKQATDLAPEGTEVRDWPESRELSV